MGIVIAQALFFFLPAYVANSSPVILARYKILEALNKPIDGNRRLWGRPIFGLTKTWRGLFGGAFMGMLVASIQALFLLAFPQTAWLYLYSYRFPEVLWLGFLLGFGILLGDLVKSFFKRRVGIKSTDPFIPFDQLDFLGALLLSQLFFPVSWQYLTVILVLSPLLPIIANIAAYKLGWKKVWW